MHPKWDFFSLNALFLWPLSRKLVPFVIFFFSLFVCEGFLGCYCFVVIFVVCFGKLEKYLANILCPLLAIREISEMDLVLQSL